MVDTVTEGSIRPSSASVAATPTLTAVAQRSTTHARWSDEELRVVAKLNLQFLNCQHSDALIAEAVTTRTNQHSNAEKERLSQTNIRERESASKRTKRFQFVVG